MSRRLARTRALAAVLLAPLLAVAGCSSPDPAGDAGATVTLVTYDSFAISEATLQAFTERTGLRVEVVRGGDAGQVVNRALLTADTPEGDVLFGLDNNLLSRVLDAGLLQPYGAAGLDQVPERYRLDDQHRVTPIDVGDVCVNYDKAYFADHALPVPGTLAELADPRYRDLLVVQNPSTSTPGLAFLLATVAQFGDPGFAGYWARLRANGVLVENSWDTAYQQRFSGGSGAGDRPLVVSYASSPPAEVVYAEQPPRDGQAPTGVLDRTCYRQIEFAGLFAQAPNPAGGQRLIDFMLSGTYQEDLPLQNFVFPVRPDARLPKVFTDNARLVDDPLTLPPDQVAAHRDAWVTTWTDVMRR